MRLTKRVIKRPEVHLMNERARVREAAVRRAFVARRERPIVGSLVAYSGRPN